MTEPVARPLLFLDVDGPLIPFGMNPQPCDGQTRPLVDSPSAGPATNPLLVRLNPQHGPRLLSLGCDLVWATTWMADANDEIAPRLGLPTLPIVAWPDTDEDDADDRLHWKTRELIDWAAGRPFVWVDDEITDRDRLFVAAHHGPHALLHRVDPRLGLTDPDFDTVRRWLAALPQPRTGT